MSNIGSNKHAYLKTDGIMVHLFFFPLNPSRGFKVMLGPFYEVMVFNSGRGNPGTILLRLVMQKKGCPKADYVGGIHL